MNVYVWPRQTKSALKRARTWHCCEAFFDFCIYVRKWNRDFYRRHVNRVNGRNTVIVRCLCFVCLCVCAQRTGQSEQWTTLLKCPKLRTPHLAGTFLWTVPTLPLIFSPDPLNFWALKKAARYTLYGNMSRPAGSSEEINHQATKFTCMFSTWSDHLTSRSV